MPFACKKLNSAALSCKARILPVRVRGAFNCCWASHKAVKLLCCVCGFSVSNEKQTLHLRDAEKCQIVEKRFGPISGKFVLYRGKDTFAEGVQYLNVENFLCGLK